jgi:uncharacterized protein
MELLLLTMMKLSFLLIYWRWLLAALLLVLLVILVWRGAIEAKELKLDEGELQLAGWPAEANGWRLLHLSDMHFRHGEDQGARVLKLAEQAQPDCVIITGDSLSSRGEGQVETLAFLREAAKRWPTFVVTGNKDYLIEWPGQTKAQANAIRSYKRGQPHPAEQNRLIEEWPATGVHLLRNTSESFTLPGGQPLWIVGVEDPNSRFDALTRAMASVPEQGTAILLAHSPEIIHNKAISRFSAIFSGHTHGGQICLPGGRAMYTHTDLPARLASGVHTVGDGKTLLVVSRGIGATRLRIRLACPAQMTVYTIKLKDKS